MSNIAKNNNNNGNIVQSKQGQKRRRRPRNSKAGRPKKGLQNYKQPVAKTQLYKQTAAKLRNVRDGITVTHREYVHSVRTTKTSWDIEDTTQLNPGNPNAFPWLSKLAQCYETYEVISFKVHYVPTCPTTTSGSITIYVDYDALETGAPQNSLQALNSANAVNFPPYAIKYHTSTRQQLNKAVKERYVDVNGGAPPGDLKLYDFGICYVITEGVPANTNLGNIFFEYTIRLKTPQMTNNAAVARFVQFTQTNVDSLTHPFFNQTATCTWFGDYELTYPYSTVGAFDSFYFDPGWFLGYINYVTAGGNQWTIGPNGNELIYLSSSTMNRIAFLFYMASSTTENARRLDVQVFNNLTGGIRASIQFFELTADQYAGFKDGVNATSYGDDILKYPGFNVAIQDTFGNRFSKRSRLIREPLETVVDIEDSHLLVKSELGEKKLNEASYDDTDDDSSSDTPEVKVRRYKKKDNRFKDKEVSPENKPPPGER